MKIIIIYFILICNINNTNAQENHDLKLIFKHDSSFKIDKIDTIILKSNYNIIKDNIILINPEIIGDSLIIKNVPLGHYNIICKSNNYLFKFVSIVSCKLCLNKIQIICKLNSESIPYTTIEQSPEFRYKDSFSIEFKKNLAMAEIIEINNLKYFNIYLFITKGKLISDIVFDDNISDTKLKKLIQVTLKKIDLTHLSLAKVNGKITDGILRINKNDLIK